MQLTALCKVLPPGGGEPFRNQILRIMKLTAALLFIACLQVSAKGIAQVTFSGKNVPLTKVFAAIEKQTGYFIAFNEAEIKNAKPITIIVKNESVENVLKQCLKGQPFDFTITDKTIFIIQKEEKTSGNIANLVEEKLLPNIDVKGRIVNEKGEPVVATVSVKGTNYSVSTNEKGEFALQNVDENAILIITGVGIETFQIDLNGRTDLALSAKTRIVEGEAVTVTVNTGYQKIPKERATGSFEHIGNKLYNREVSTDILSRLENIASGLYVSKIEGRNDYVIRGLSTLFSNRAPLIVIDNLPYYGNINNINPNDVEDVTILKDAAAASIWGSQAGNGVIVITTKKGNYNRLFEVHFNSNVTFQKKPDLFYGRNFLASEEFIEVEKFLFSKGFYSGNLSNPFYTVSPVVTLLDMANKGLIPQAEADKQISQLKSFDIRNDYTNYLYRTSVNQQYSIGFSGGSEKVNFYLQAGYDNDLSTVIGNKTDRKTVKSSLNFRPLSKLEIQTVMSYSSTVYTNNGMNSATFNPGGGHSFLYPYARLADDNGSALAIPKDYNTAFIDTVGQGLLLDWRYKPLDELKNMDNSSLVSDIVANISLHYKLTNYMTFSGLYQYQNQNQETQSYFNPETYYTRNLINLYSQFTGTEIKNNLPPGGIRQSSFDKLTVNSFRGQVNFNHSWRGLHDLNAIIGAEISEQRIIGKSFTLYGFDENTLNFSNVDYATNFNFYGNIGSGNIPSGIGNTDKINRLTSIFANGAYSYKSKYILSASARKDASNIYGVKTNQKGVPLWSTGIKWKLSEETFYKSAVLPLLNLRLTYGYNGNSNNNLSAVTTIVYRPAQSIINIPGAVIGSFPNEKLRWEKVKQWDAGIDFQLKKNVVSGSVDFYLKYGLDLISPAPLDPTLGMSQMFFNSANTEGRGIDVKLNFKIVDRAFKWTNQLLFNYTKTKVSKYLLEFPTPYAYVNFGYSINPIEGNDPYALISYRFAGLDPQTGDPQGYFNGSKSNNYSALATTLNWGDLVTRGTTRPPYFGSLLNFFSYKGFMLSTNITYQLGFLFRRSTINYDALFNGWAGHVDFQRRWQKPGDEKFTNIPSMVYPNSSLRDKFFNYSDANIEKGDFIRLQDVNLSYSPRLSVGGYSIQNPQLYIYARNLGILWRANKLKIDPDYGEEIPERIAITFGFRCDF